MYTNNPILILSKKKKSKACLLYILPVLSFFQLFRTWKNAVKYEHWIVVAFQELSGIVLRVEALQEFSSNKAIIVMWK